jgi:surface antigen
MKKLLIISTVISVIGCASGGPKQAGGTLIGGATGALIGSQFGKGSGQLVGVAIGTLAGSQIGAAIGKSMDDKDRELSAQSALNSLEYQPDNRPVIWRNPNNNHSGIFVATRTQQVNTNKVCRDYVQTVIIDGEETKVYGRACRDMRDVKGQWTVAR